MFCFQRYFPLTTDQQQPHQIILTTSEAVDLHQQPHSDLALVQQHQSPEKTVVVMGPLEPTAAAAPDGSHEEEEVLMSFSINDPSMTPVADHSS